GRHLLGVRYLPVELLLGADERTRIATTQRHGSVEVLAVELFQPLGRVRGQVVADFLHGLDRLRIDPTRWAGTGTVCLHHASPVNSGESLGHLAAVRVLDADEKTPLHGQASFEGATTLPQQPGSCTHRHAKTPTQAPREPSTPALCDQTGKGFSAL